MATSILSRYHEIMEKTLRSGNPIREKTLDGWHRRTITTRDALLLAKEQYRADVEDLRGTYSPKVFEVKRQNADREYRELVRIAQEKVTADLQTVLESKRAQYDRSAGAPSAEDLRLLEALNMRSSLSIAEIATVSGKFNNNIQALRVLGDIARKHGISFPDIGDPETFEESLKRAEEFATDHIAELDTDKADLGYRGLLFWTKPGEGEAKYFFGQLDGAGFSSEQISTSTKESQRATWTPTTSTTASKTTGAAPGEVWAEVRATGQQDIGTIASQFHVTTQQIRDANPGIDLDRLYSGTKVLVPSTRFTFQPDPTGGHVQPDQVRPVPRPIVPDPVGPSGESIGQDISIFREADGE